MYRYILEKISQTVLFNHTMYKSCVFPMNITFHILNNMNRIYKSGLDDYKTTNSVLDIADDVDEDG